MSVTMTTPFMPIIRMISALPKAKRLAWMVLVATSAAIAAMRPMMVSTIAAKVSTEKVPKKVDATGAPVAMV